MSDDEERREVPDMTRERARSERRDVDKERGEPLSGSTARGGPRALRTTARPVPEWTSRPRILITNDDGVESRGLLALKQALETMGDVTVVAPDTNQSAVGHQKTLMRPLRVRERILADGSLAYSVDGSPTDAVSIAFLGYFGHGFDLVAAGINYGANLGDDITYSGTVSAAMEARVFISIGSRGGCMTSGRAGHTKFSTKRHHATRPPTCHALRSLRPIHSLSVCLRASAKAPVSGARTRRSARRAPAATSAWHRARSTDKSARCSLARTHARPRRSR